MVEAHVRSSIRAWLPAWAALLLSLFAGCAGLPPQVPPTPDELAWVTGGAGLLPAAKGSDVEDPSALLHVSDDMRRFAKEAVQHRFSVAAKTMALVDAMDSEQGLHLQYDAEATLTAEQAFRQKRANCLSYTMLFVTLAREVGIPAKFYNVDIPPMWDMGDDNTALLYKHINARVEVGSSSYQVIDISGEQYDPHLYYESPISDSEAAAQFYNNRAVQLRLQQRPVDALRYQLRAVQMAPASAYLWTNLADLYLIEGKPRAAHMAVTHGLELDSSDPLAFQTAALAYEQLGESGLARDFYARARHFIEQNPYYHYHLALVAMRRDDNAAAYEEIREAVGTRVRDPRFFFVLAVVLDRMGDTKHAADSMAVVMQLTADVAQQERYRNKFARLKEQQG